MITLSAEAAYGHSGQFVAQIKGRDPKFTFNYEFLGRKSGKRNECTSHDVDTAGLYVERDIGRKGDKNDTYPCVLEYETKMRKIYIEKADAMKLAKGLDEGRALSDMIEFVMESYMEPGVRYYSNETKEWVEPPATEKTSLVYRLIDKKRQAKNLAAGNLQSAVEACRAIMASLPTDVQKKVIAALKNDIKEASACAIA